MNRKLKALAVLITVSAALFSQTTRPVTRADVSGASTTVQISTTGSARWVQLLVPSTNTGVSRWGDASTTVSRGGTLPAGSGQMLPPLPVASGNQVQLYDLTSIYVYVATGDSLTAVWGQ